MSLGLLIRLLILLLIIRAIWRLVSGIVEGAAEPRRNPPERRVPLVRDPVCGTYVVRSKALTASAGGEVKYFCSERCRRTYAGSGG